MLVPGVLIYVTTLGIYEYLRWFRGYLTTVIGGCFLNSISSKYSANA